MHAVIRGVNTCARACASAASSGEMPIAVCFAWIMMTALSRNSLADPFFLRRQIFGLASMSVATMTLLRLAYGTHPR